MSGYSQPGPKRQKVKEMKDVDYFQGIDKIEYNNMAAVTDTSVYRYYSPSERVHARTMEEWLKCSLSLTEFRMNDFGKILHVGWDHDSEQEKILLPICPQKYLRCDNRPKPRIRKHIVVTAKPRSEKTRSWDDHSNSLENHKRSVKALFDLLHKLGIKYWTAFDSDLLPPEEEKGQGEEMAEFINELTQRYHVKLLWLAPDLHSNARYASGALTSPDASTFILAASQIKKCLELSQRLNAENFLLWPCREGYNAIFQTDVAREIKLFAKLLKMTAEYKDKLNYRCQLLIMPYCGRKYSLWQHWGWRDEKVHSYMWDVTSCLYFLKSYNLERFYKVCSPPGHHLYMANVYNMLGGVTITNDFDQYNSKKLTLMMKSIVDQGTTPPGGINLRLYRRDADLRGITTLYLKYIDSMAKALRLACNVVGEQVFSKHVQQRYVSYHSGLGSRLAGGEISMEECEESHKKNQNQSEATSKCEHYDVVFQRYLDSCDHI